MAHVFRSSKEGCECDLYCIPWNYFRVLSLQNALSLSHHALIFNWGCEWPNASRRVSKKIGGGRRVGLPCPRKWHRFSNFGSKRYNHNNKTTGNALKLIKTWSDWIFKCNNRKKIFLKPIFKSAYIWRKIGSFWNGQACAKATQWLLNELTSCF